MLPVLVGIVLFARSLEAAEFFADEKTVIAAGEVIDDDVFATGQSVVVDGTINGDLFAGGESITINGQVNGNVIMGGGELILDGGVAGNVYSGGYGLTIADGARIDRSLYAAGYSITSETESRIGRSASIGGYQAMLNGEIVRDLSVGLGALELDGRVGGDVNGEVGSSESPPPDTNSFMSGFTSGFESTSGQRINFEEIPAIDPGLRIEDGVVAGDINVTESVPPSELAEIEATEEATSNTFLRRLTPLLGELIAMLAIGALVIWKRPSWFGRFNNIVPNRALASLGWGALWTVAAPFVLFFGIAALFLLSWLTGLLSFGRLDETVIGVGGTGLAFVSSLFVFAFRLLAPMFVLTTLGNWVLNKFMEQGGSAMSFGRLFGALALGAITLQLLGMIPFVGNWIIFLISLVGIGALFLLFRGRNAPDETVIHETNAPDHLKEKMA